jgi:hypothetical protein
MLLANFYVSTVLGKSAIHCGQEKAKPQRRKDLQVTPSCPSIVTNMHCNIPVM